MKSFCILAMLLVASNAYPQFQNWNPNFGNPNQNQNSNFGGNTQFPNQNQNQNFQPNPWLGGQAGQQSFSGVSTQRPTNVAGSTTTAAPTTASPRYLSCLRTCPSTSEYNPICGSDNINYHNNGFLNCAINCGQNVVAVRMGTCQPL